MTKTTQRIYLGCWCSIWLALIAVTSRAETPLDAIVISAGIHGGGYWNAATRLQAAAREMELAVQVRESRGSLHNLQRLDDPASPVSLALTQTDALQYYLESHPALADRAQVLEHIGQECVYVIAGKSSGIRTIADLQAASKSRIAIVSARSGVAATFQYMQALVPELAKTEAVYTDTLLAMEQLNRPEREFDAVMTVHRPKEIAAELALALEDPSAFQLVEVADPRFSGKLPNGERIYSAVKLALPEIAGRAPGFIRTLCVRSLLIADKFKLSREQRYGLDELLDYHWMRIYVPDR